MAEKKNQHFVPKVHLKHFAKDNFKKQIDIWLPKHNRIILGASINDQCAKNYFYGKDLKVENFFNFPEGVFGQISNRLMIDSSPTKSDLDALLFFWLLQHIRSERAASEKMLLEIAMREKISLGEETDSNLEKFLGKPMSIPDVIKLNLDNARYYYDNIIDLRLAILINNTKYKFIMSDNPAVSSNKFILKRFKNHNWGLAGAGIYLFMPITPKIGFLAFDKYIYELSGRIGHTCKITDSEAKALNQLVYLFSDNLIVLPPNENHENTIEPLRKISQTKPENLMRVNIAVKDNSQFSHEYTRYLTASDEDFKKFGGLIHIQSLPPTVPMHFQKLKIKCNPRFIDTKSGAGLRRFRAK